MDDTPNRNGEVNKFGKQKKQPASNYPVGCLRSVILFPVGLLLSILIGIASGQSLGFLWGIIIGIVAFSICFVVVVFVLNRSKTLTIFDCTLPFVISAIAAIAFSPVSLISADALNIATCIFSGAMLSVGLILYRIGRLKGAYLVIPMLTFIYEILPIDLPASVDNIIGFGVNTLNLVVGAYLDSIKKPKE
jgi:hypothetical protein